MRYPPYIPTGNPNGRPSTFNKEIADEICFRMSNGESCRTICREERMPCVATIFNWLRDNKEFLEQYTLAKERLVECYADEIAEIADDATNDFYEKALKNGEVSVVGDMELVNRSRLRVDARKWICERLAPKKYGPKSDVNLSGTLEHNLFIQNAIAKSKECA